MQTIQIHHPYRKNQIPTEEVVMALGFFDGVHRGHQKVIKTAKKTADARGLKLAVMTFNHHPSVVFKKNAVQSLRYLTTIDQKKKQMERLGVDYLYVIEFTSSFANLSPQAFVDQYLVELHVKIAVAGFDYTYGKREVANMVTLPDYAKGRFEIVEVLKEVDKVEKISSTRIRELMAQGNMEEANRCLGYPYQISGLVVHGDKRGRTLGFPTANVAPHANSLLPRGGVYAVKIKVANKWHLGMAQIGYNITFEADRPMTIEVNILDFDQDIYGEHVSVAWYHFIRSELKFDGVEGLVEQLKQDQQDTEGYFNQLGE